MNFNNNTFFPVCRHLLIFGYLSSAVTLTLLSPASLAQECGYVYVTSNGASSGSAGTKSNPANLAYGLTLVSSVNNIVRIASGTYNFSTELNMIGDVTLEGGFNALSWVKSNATPTIFHRDTANVLSSPNRLIAVKCIGISNFRLLDLTITMDDASGNGVSTYGIYLNGCSNYTISRCIIDPGNASAGFQGAPGMQGMAGAAGTGGETGTEQGDCCRLPGVGGAGSFPGSYKGGEGGLGAQRPTFQVDVILGLCYASNFRTEDGYAGYPGLGMGGAQGGIGGKGVCELEYIDSVGCYAQTLNHGAPGQVGNNGYNAQNGLPAIGNYSGGFYIPGVGSLGYQGTHAGGGGGGGGGGAKGCEPVALDPFSCDTLFWSWGTGGGGGGGGEGGQGGFTGQGGMGGGSSFCIFVWASGPNGIIRDCYLNPGLMGMGGAGGPGGVGGSGGAGGVGGKTGANPVDFISSCNTGQGGDGGTGGNGGNGGNGGKGSDGVSVPIYQDTSGLPLLISNAYNPFEPPVTVQFSGCGNSDLIFSTTATGNINWIFGFGANPQGSSNATDTVQYDNGALGSRTITLIVDGVPYSLANFITLNQNFTPPEISVTATTVCAGDAINLSSTQTANTYNWAIPGGSITTSSQQNPGSVTFNTTGTYLISLTSSSCCGISYTEQLIDVISSVNVNIGPDTAICFTDPLPVLDAGNPNANYSWTLNGSPTGGNTQTLQVSVPGTYSVTVAYGSCSTTDALTFNVYTELPVDIGADTSICIGGTFPVLDAGLPNMNSYIWGLDGNPVGTNSQFLQTSTPGTYTVTLTSSTGCMGSDSLTLSLSIPTVELGSNKSFCDNAPFPVLNAGNPGSVYNWFLNGSPVGGNTQTLQTASGGAYSVALTNQYGCTAGDSIVLTVLITLNGAFSFSPTTTVGSTVFFTDNSSPSPASWNWSFGDGSANDSIQNPSHVYNTAGIYPVFLIVGNGICFDTVISSIEVLNDCSTFGLFAGFNASPDTVDLAGLGIVTFTNTSTGSLSWNWNFGDGSPATTVKDPLHTFVDTGIYTVSLTAYNYNCSDGATYIIVVINSKTLPPVDTTIGIAVENLEVSNLMVYPNPNSGVFVIAANFNSRTDFNLQIINLMGKTIFRENITDAEFYRKEFQWSEEAKGVYFIELQTPDGYIVRKIIIN